MFLQKTRAVVGAVVVCALASPAGGISAADEPTGEPCRRDCQTSKEERDAICGGLPAQQARETCLASSVSLHEKCVRACSSGDDVEACKRRCDRKASAGHRKCARLKPGPERAKCRQAVEEQRSTCYRDCEREAK